MFAAPVAAAERADETEYWIPSFGPFFDVLGQKASGSVEPGDVLGTPLTEGGCPVTSRTTGVTTRNGDLCYSGAFDQPIGIRPYPKRIFRTEEGNDTSVAPMVGFTFELMTPSLLDRWLRPRVFAHGEFAASFGFERNLAGDGRPDTFSIPFIPTGAVKDRDEAAVDGQGTRTRLQLERWVYSGGAGIAFSTDLFSRRVRIKPSFEYLRQEIELIGVVHRALKLEDPALLNNFESVRLIALTQTKMITLDGFGPGLELEADTARVGPFVTSVYMTGRGYYFFDNLEHTLTATTTDPDGCDTAGNCESARWTYDIDPWAWRAGVGFRFRWLPE